MNEYNGEWYGYFSGINHSDQFDFTTYNHYPGDPNFSGSFTGWIRAVGDAKRQALIAFNEKLRVVIEVKGGNIVKVQKVMDI
jgi:hypothetical protein